MAFLTDSLRAAIGAASRLNPFSRLGGSTSAPNTFTNQLALAAYMSSGMLRKVIAIPAEDRVREWRDWQAEKEQIAAIEEEERRLGLQAKVKAAEILRGIGGGALILITGTSDHAQELKPDTIAKGGLLAINVVSRWQLQGQDWVRDLASLDYGTPRMFQINGDGQQRSIHPSRVICFRGDPLPAGSAVGDEEAFWGDSRILRVFAEVERADCAQAWFAELVKKAKLLRIGIPDLADLTSTTAGRTKLDSRIALIAEGENLLNATVFSAAGGADQAGETISDFQVTWAGIPAMMDAFDQRVAAVSDIPFTRLMGRSPAGMNATGEHDMDNWDRAVMAGQRLETRPCLEALDPVLIRSAGVAPEKVTWRFAPLSTPSEQQQAETFDKRMDAVTKLQNTGAIPDVAFAKAVQNLLSETEDLPGLDQALAEIPEDERFGLTPEPGDEGVDPSALIVTTNGGKEAIRASAGGGVPAQRPARRAANDTRFADGADPKTLYIQRKLLNAAEVIRWAKSVGLETTLAAADMHVTIAFSRTPVDWFSVGTDWSGDEDGRLRVKPGGPRAVERLGDGDEVALIFASDDLRWRHERIREAGASWDWPDYRSHVTLSWNAPDVDVSAIAAYSGPLVFGPELFSEVREDWKATIEEE